MNQTQVSLHMKEKESQGVAINYVGISPIEQLELKYNSNNVGDMQELGMILGQILSYPSTQLADIHKAANRLGNHDIRKEQDQKIKTQESQLIVKPSTYCSCCGFIKQDQEVKLCTPLKDLNNVGISTFLYFQTLKNLSFLLTEMFLIYGIYALATNILAANAGDPANVSSYIPTDVLAISLGSKETYQTDTNSTYYYIQCWIGVALVAVWGVTFVILKYFEKADQVRVQDQTISASDFSVVIQYMPTELTQQDVQNQFDDYFQTLTNVPENLRKPLKILKYNVGKPFYLNVADLKDQEVNQITKRSQDLIGTFIDWIYERQDSSSFSTTKEFRQEKYKEYDQLCKQKTAKVEQLIGRIKQEFKAENHNQVTTVFITFETNHARSLICSQNSVTAVDRIRYFLTCCQSENRFKPATKDGVSHSVNIMRAPQPEDVIWTNLGVAQSVLITRKIITYLVTIVLLGISFVAVYGLTLAQTQNSSNQILSVIISITISLVNIILGQVIRRLTLFERDYTETTHQTSLGMKSVLAQLVNSILVPIIANWFIEGNNLYAANGLAEDVFYLGITNALLTPMLKIFDISFMISRVLAWSSKRISKKMWLNQAELNDANELVFFEVGYEYIYLVNLFLFNCFFVSLQPIIVVFALLGYFLMYWSQKYSLFNKMRRPVPGTDLINVAMGQLMLTGGMLYSLGSLCWSNIFPGGIPATALIPNLISAGLGFLLFIFPYSTIFHCIFGDQKNLRLLVYDEQRIFLSSEYDRLNPSTAEEGFKDYMKFVEDFKNKMQTAPKEQQLFLIQKLANQGKKGTRKMKPLGAFGGGPGLASPFAALAGGMSGRPVNGSFFLSPQQPSFNAMMLSQHLLPQNKNDPQMIGLPLGLLMTPNTQRPSISQPPPLFPGFPQSGPNQNNEQPNPPTGFNNPPQPPQIKLMQQQPLSHQFGPPQQLGFGMQPLQPGFRYQQGLPRFSFQKQGQPQQPFGFGFPPQNGSQNSFGFR